MTPYCMVIGSQVLIQGKGSISRHTTKFTRNKESDLKAVRRPEGMNSIIGSSYRLRMGIIKPSFPKLPAIICCERRKDERLPVGRQRKTMMESGNRVGRSLDMGLRWLRRYFGGTH